MNCLPGFESVAIRFNAKWMPEPNSGCWIWTGGLSNGRPSFGFRTGKTEPAYRTAYRIFRGDVPDGLYACHHCDNPACVNPHHIFLGTQADNLADMARKGRGHGPCKDRQSAKFKVKLTDDQVREIRLYPAPSRATAKVFGVSQVLVAAIRRRAVWRHVI